MSAVAGRARALLRSHLVLAALGALVVVAVLTSVDDFRAVQLTQLAYLGIAGGPVPNQMRFVETGIFDAVIHHNRYTLLNRSAEPLIQAAHERGMAILNAAPYGSGMLVKGPDAYPRYAYQQASPQMIDRVRQYQAIAERYGVPLAAVALQFSTRDPRTTATIVGMSRPSRIDDTIRYLTTPIPDALWEEIADIPYEMDDPEVNRFK